MWGGVEWGNGTADLTTKVNSFDDLNKNRFFLLNRLRM